MDASGIGPNECVLVADLDNGQRFETYVVEGPAGSGVICINGAAARLVNIGDLVIIMAFGYCTQEEAATFKPRIVLVDPKNRPVKTLLVQSAGRMRK